MNASLRVGIWTRTRPGEMAYRRPDGVTLVVFTDATRRHHARAVASTGEVVARVANAETAPWALILLLGELRREEHT